jgi:hypothetical protein
MTHCRDEYGNRRYKRWTEWSLGAKVASIAAGIIFVPAFLALFAAITMWLWNWLMPVIFKLPAITFWQAAGLLILSHLLFKGSHLGKSGRSHWKSRKIREHMSEEAPDAKPL